MRVWVRLIYFQRWCRVSRIKPIKELVVPDLVRHLGSQRTAVNPSTSKSCHEPIHTLRPEMLKQVQHDEDVWASGVWVRLIYLQRWCRVSRIKPIKELVVPDLVRHLGSQRTAVNPSTSKPCHEAIHTLRHKILKPVQHDEDERKIEASSRVIGYQTQKEKVACATPNST